MGRLVQPQALGARLARAARHLHDRQVRRLELRQFRWVHPWGGGAGRSSATVV